MSPQKASEIEHLLYRYFGADGKGLGTKAKQLESILPQTLTGAVWEISQKRNSFLHGHPHRRRTHFADGSERSRYIELAAWAKSEIEAFRTLQALPRCELALRNKEYNVVLDSWKITNGPWQVHGWPEWHGGDNQRWFVSRINSEELAIWSAASGHCLDAWYSEDRGWNLHLWPYHGGSNQQWSVTQLDDYSYRITRVENGLCLDATHRTETGSVTMILWKWHGGDNQRWWIGPLFE